MDDVMKDKRFQHIARDPRFRRMKRGDRKVQIDKRFQSMFKDSKFNLKYSVDKRGRPVNTSTNENLQKYYDMESSDESQEESEDEEDKKDAEHVQDTEDSRDQKPVKEKEKKTESKLDKEAKKVSQVKKIKDGSDGEEEATVDGIKELGGGEEADSDQDAEREKEDADDSDDSRIGPDVARGQGNVETSSSEEEEEEEEEELDHQWGELDQDAVTVEDATRRLAMCNMDWDRIKANDIMVLLNSFKPSHGTVQEVTIYPSDYGLQRMKEEEVRGPIELVESSNKGLAETHDDPHSIEKLRKYQLNRLRYYYAVIACDSVETANKIYEECDGMEYESSSTKIDLRFVPDDMTFDQEPKSRATHVPDASTYTPTLFTNSALNQSKVDLTWDETNKDRIALTMRKFKPEELEELDVKDYLASSSSDGEGEDPYQGFADPDFEPPEPKKMDEAVDKLKDLVKTVDDKKKDKEPEGELEIMWESGLQSSTSGSKHKEGTTPWEDYLQKKKEKKKKKREEKTKSTDKTKDVPAREEGAAFSDDELPEGVDLQDSFFTEELGQPQPGKPKKKKKGKGQKTAANEEDAEEAARLRMLMMDEDDGRQHFSLAAIQEKESNKKKKKKAKRKPTAEPAAPEDNFRLDVQDSRFSEIYINPLYNIDPSAPEYKKTQAMDSLVTEKFKRREKMGNKKMNITECEVPSKKARTEPGKLQDASLASLVKSVKAKTKTLQEKKKKKHKL